MKKPLAIILAAVLLGGVIGYDLFIATCDDSEGRDMTATFWTLLEETP